MTPTPEALAKARKVTLAIMEEEGSDVLMSNGEVWLGDKEDVERMDRHIALALTEQAKAKDAEIANRQAEVERLRAFVEQLRRDSLHEDLVRKLAEQAQKIERLTQELAISHTTIDLCNKQLAHNGWEMVEIERRTWEAALADVRLAQEVAREELVNYNIGENPIMAKFCKGFIDILAVLEKTFRAAALPKKDD